MNTGRFARIFMICLILCCTALAADWPQFRGPNRDGKSGETDLLEKWPAEGPELLWSADGLGDGWSSAAIADGLVYITGLIDKQGFVFCFDLRGKPKWKIPYGPEWTRSYPGSRTTPTVDDGRFYIFSGMGVASCFDARTGERIWRRDVFTEFEGEYPRWGMSECLLIDGDNVICTPGGRKASIVALNKLTGDVVWAASDVSEPSTYENPILVEYGGTRMIVTMLQDSVLAVEASTGKLLWRDSFDEYHVDRTRRVNCNPPLYHDGFIHTTSGYNNGGAMLQLAPDGRSITRKWIDKTLDTHHGGTVLVDGHIYGSNYKTYTTGDWACLNWETGETIYDQKWHGNKGSLIYADGMLYCYDENRGHLGLVKATPAGFEPVSEFQITRGKGKYWAHPSISDGRLYVRHGEFLMVYDIRKR